MVQNLFLSGLWCDSSGKSYPWPHVTGSNHDHVEWHPGHTYKMHMEGRLILCSDLGTIPKTLFDYMCAHSLGWSHWRLRHFWFQTFSVRDAQAVPRKEEQTASVQHADRRVIQTEHCYVVTSSWLCSLHSVSLICLPPGLWQSKAPRLCTECSCFSEPIEHLLTLLIKMGIEHSSSTPSCVRIFLFVCMFMCEEIHVSMCEPVCRDPRSTSVVIP